MTLKEKIVGILLIVVGVIPFLGKFGLIKYEFLTNYLVPGEIIYQFVLVILGIILILEKRRR